MSVLLAHRGFEIFIDAEEGDACRWELHPGGYVVDQPAQRVGRAPTFREAFASAKAAIEESTD